MPGRERGDAAEVALGVILWRISAGERILGGRKWRTLEVPRSLRSVEQLPQSYRFKPVSNRDFLAQAIFFLPITVGIAVQVWLIVPRISF